MPIVVVVFKTTKVCIAPNFLLFPLPLPHAGVDEWRTEEENRRADGNGNVPMATTVACFEVMMQLIAHPVASSDEVMYW